ncbi:hypothetical protein L208DRAFT_1392428 [Tricholoma matsutake]|nr:hypothetical protein L208DRAFT_1392428 [Tricholoma matsutake 945]
MLQAPRCCWMLTWLSWRLATMMHAASGNSQALGQELGLMANSSSFGEAPHPIWTGRAIDWAWLGIVLHLHLAL